jgi:hypothetical protein
LPTALSSLLGIDSSHLTDRDAFDPVLDFDTRLFIDPHLLKHCRVPELAEGYLEFKNHFRKLGKLLAASKFPNDRFWREADTFMNWPEVKGLCIGYSKRGTSGSGIGPELRKRLLGTAKEIIDQGKNDPELFELVGLFEDDFGADRISDMTANVIREHLKNFTQRVLEEMLSIGAQDLEYDALTGLPVNPFTSMPLLLVPRSILRDLPVALDWSSRDLVAQHNDELRQKVNSTIGDSWKDATSTFDKKGFKDFMLEHPDLIDDLFKSYRDKAAQPYDFVEDRAGEYVWLPASKKAVADFSLSLCLPENPNYDQVEALVMRICEQFKSLVENNGLCSLFYNSDGTLKHEKAAQLLFYGIADGYCKQSGIMIARESDAGRGPVDFKFGSNMENSVLVELKKSTNTSGLKNGILKQLPTYMKAEGAKRAIYIVIDVGYTIAAVQNLKDINQLINGAKIKVMHIDGTIKPSASKL